MQFGICVSNMGVGVCVCTRVLPEHMLSVCKSTVRTSYNRVYSYTLGINFVAVDGIASTSIKITLPVPFTDILNREYGISKSEMRYMRFMLHVWYRHVNYAYLLPCNDSILCYLSRSLICFHVHSTFDSVSFIFT